MPLIALGGSAPAGSAEGPIEVELIELRAPTTGGTSTASDVSGDIVVGGSYGDTYPLYPFVYDVGAETPTLVDLGALGGSRASARAIDGDVVVGSLTIAEGAHAFAYDLGAENPTVVDLGTLGGTYSAATDVSGDIVVGTSDLPGGTSTHAFAYDLGATTPTMIDLGTLGGMISRARAVSGGIVVGSAQTEDGNEHAFAYDLRAEDPRMVDLGTLGGPQSYAVDVSGRHVVGNSARAGDFAPRGFAYDFGAEKPMMLGLGTLGGSATFVSQISGSIIVGHSFLARSAQRDYEAQHAFAYDLRAEVPRMLDLGALEDDDWSDAYAVSGGLVVGESAGRPFFYDLYAETPTMVALETPATAAYPYGLPNAVSGNVIVGEYDQQAVAWRLTGRAQPVRLAGESRYETAAAISRDSFPDGAGVAVVATGAKFPDALAGGAAAVAVGGPLLLTEQHAVPDATRAELVRLGPSRILLLGGTQAVSDEALASLEDVAPVERIFGADRFETAAAVSRRVFPAASDVYVATGAAFPDALVAGAAAGHENAAVILVSGSAVPSAALDELSRLQPQRIVVVGGAAAVGEEVVEELETFAPVERVAGRDRYATAAEIAARAFQTADATYVATGLRFPDALAGAAAAGLAGAPVLLVHESTPDDTYRELLRLRPDRVVVLGGTRAVPETVATELTFPAR